MAASRGSADENRRQLPRLLHGDDELGNDSGVFGYEAFADRDLGNRQFGHRASARDLLETMHMPLNGLKFRQDDGLVSHD
jgi:hypothetical protein